jgi:plasmid stabilization system protein ParE
MRCAIDFAPEAEEHLAALAIYIADNASPRIAEGYLGALVESCESLREFPHRGTRRDDVRPGLRITHHHGRAIIAFAIDELAVRVTILGIYYGGRDYESDLRLDDEA